MAITQNPHVKDPKVLWKTIEEQERAITGEPDKTQEFDATGFEMLKARLSENPRFVVKS